MTHDFTIREVRLEDATKLVEIYTYYVQIGKENEPK